MEDPTDDAFLARTSTDELLETAHDQLRLDGDTLWTWDTGTEHVAGWMTASSDDTAMRILAPALGSTRDLRLGDAARGQVTTIFRQSVDARPCCRCVSTRRTSCMNLVRRSQSLACTPSRLG